MNTPDTEWEMEDREQAQEAFDILSKFFMRNCNRVPESVLEACDYVSNYLGDIAMGREITIDKPEDAFPSLLSTRDTYWKERVKEAYEKVSSGEMDYRDAFDDLLDNLK